MSIDEVSELWLALPILESEEMLRQLQVNSYPHMSKANQTKVFNQIKKQATISFEESSKTLKLEDIARNLAMRAKNG